MKSNKINFTKKFFWPNSLFCNFKNDQKSIFELGKLPKMQFHEKNVWFIWLHEFFFFCLDLLNFLWYLQFFQNLFHHHSSHCQHRIQLGTIKLTKFCTSCHCFSVCVDDVDILSTFVISFGRIEKNFKIGFQRSEFRYGCPRTIKIYN